MNKTELFSNEDKRYVSSLVIRNFRAYKDGECRVFPTKMQAERFSNMVEPFKTYKAIYEKDGVYYECEG